MNAVIADSILVGVVTTATVIMFRSVFCNTWNCLMDFGIRLCHRGMDYCDRRIAAAIEKQAQRYEDVEVPKLLPGEEGKTLRRSGEDASKVEGVNPKLYRNCTEISSFEPFGPSGLSKIQ